MKVLVINAGSSSLKYQLVDMTSETVMAKGLCERIGLEDGIINHKTSSGYNYKGEAKFPTHAEAFREVVKQLTTGENAVISSMSEISAAGHRMVQGGEGIRESTLLNEETLREVEQYNDLAPLHNPATIMGVRACISVLGEDIPQVGVFDTAFHSTLPPKAYMYPVPYEWYEKYRVRRYGFHGTSHRFVSARLAQVMGKPLSELKIVTCHLGNGSSITAIDQGKSVDTTMGFTPLEGLIMGTRAGSIDPAIIPFMEAKLGLSGKEVENLLNKKAGYLGVSGLTNDQRDLNDAAEQGNARAQLAVDIQRYQIKKYIGAFAAAMGGLDAVVFTGGIGENDDEVRAEACSGLEFMGIQMDLEVNKGCRVEKMISTPDSKVKVYIIPTNEELLIARDTMRKVTG